MAKKFVRGITDIKTINNQDLDTNNVNDLLSDGKHNYIHRKKGNTEEYHNLTNNIKTIESSNTSLLSVTNYNNSNNTARLTPKHDRRKEQLLESTDNTIVITHGENGTDETTSVDVNPDKIAEMVAPMVAPTNRQIYYYTGVDEKVYGTLKTFVRPINDEEEEFFFIAHTDKGQSNSYFEGLTEHDFNAFKYIYTKYDTPNDNDSDNHSVWINGTTMGIALDYVYFDNDNFREYASVIRFSDIIPTNPVETTPSEEE